jgi:small-conductance mechanosensitive channel
MIPEALAELLDRQVLGAPLLRWGQGALLALVVFSALVLIRRLLVSRLERIAARTPTPVDDIVVDLVRRTRPAFLAVLALWAAAGLVQPAGGVARILRFGGVIVVTLQAALWVSAAVTQAIEIRRRAAEPAAATTLGALGVLIRLVLYAILLVLALSNLGVNVTALVAGLGIGGVALALALQNILGDLFASLAIVLDKPFVVGDFVVVGDLSGTVEHVGLKTTRVRSLSGEQIVFGNKDLLESRIRNFKRMNERRVLFRVGVVYDTPPEVLSRIPGLLRRLVEAEPGLRFERAHFKELADSALTFEVVYFVLNPDYGTYMDIHQRILFGLVERFAAEGIEFAYPTRTVYLREPNPAPGAPAATASPPAPPPPSP